MDAEHKAKLSQGRADARSVKMYLSWLEENRPRRGRRRTKQSIENRLAVIETDRPNASVLKRLAMFQEEVDLQAELAALSASDDGSEARNGFIEAAARYAENKGIGRDAFKQMGVDIATLKEAGIA